MGDTKYALCLAKPDLLVLCQQRVALAESNTHWLRTHRDHVVHVLCIYTCTMYILFHVPLKPQDTARIELCMFLLHSTFLTSLVSREMCSITLQQTTCAHNVHTYIHITHTVYVYHYLSTSIGTVISSILLVGQSTHGVYAHSLTCEYGAITLVKENPANT